MGAMNQGVMDVDGKVVGVIHEMFVKKESSYVEGCHEVFKQDRGERVQLVIVGGKDLQERKRKLVEDADALIVLPGGPGTFDELWEMACAKQIGFIKMPIVCVNVNGYYNSFKNMLHRAHKDEFLYKHPSEILHFEDTSAKAVEYIEAILNSDEKEKIKNKMNLRRKPSMLRRMMSTFNVPEVFSTPEDADERSDAITTNSFQPLPLTITFLIGVSTGLLLRTIGETCTPKKT